MALTQISTQGIKDGTITGADLATNVDLVDNQKLRLGTGNDLQIYHDGTNSLISDTGNGYLKIDSNGSGIYLTKSDGESMASFITDGAVELFHNGTKKFETTSAGATVTGSLTLTDDLFLSDANVAYFGTNNDLRIYHSGTHGYIKNTTNNLYIMTTNSEYGALLYANGGVELRYDNVKKFETVSNGARVIGSLGVDELYMGDNEQIKIGAEDDFLIYHGGSENVLDGVLHKIELRHGSEKHLVANPDGAVELYHDNSKKFETAAGGVVIPSGANNCLRIFGSNATHATSALIIGQNNNTTSQLRAYGPDASTNGRIELRSSRSDASNTKNIFYDSGNLEFPNSQKAVFGDGDDLQIYHDGTHSYIDNQTGALYLRNNTGTYNGNPIVLEALSGENALVANPNGSVKLYYDNSKKLETTTNGGSLTGDWNVSNDFFWFDNGEAVFGSGGDFKIYHDGTNNVFKSTNGEIRLMNGTEYMFRAIPSGANRLYHANSTKAETLSTGFMVNGHLDLVDNDKIRLGASQDLQIYHNGTGSLIDNDTGNLLINTASGEVQINKSTSEYMARFIVDGAVELYYDNSKKFKTISAGVQVASGHLHLPDSSELRLGSDNDLKAYHNGTSAIMQNYTNNFYFGNYSNNSLIFQTNNTNRWQINNSGHFIPDANNTVDIGASSTRVRNIYTNDLNLSNEGGANDVDGTWGSYTIQEGAEDLFLVNKRNGKKYKFNLTEVS
jgi:hypothetical protein